MTHLALRQRAQALRRDELRRIARLIAIKWSTFPALQPKIPPCPAPAPKHHPASLATPSA